jgi:hypothetical protein
MRNWSSWKGYGWFIRVCTGVYILCCGARSIPGPLVAGTRVHRDHHRIGPLYSFLGLFAPVHAQDVQIRSIAHMVLPSELLLLEQYYNIILMLQKESQPSDLLNK